MASALVPLRDDVSAAVIALLLVLPVVAGAVVGGRSSGAASAVVSVLCFDFFFTVPYGSLSIESADDVEATLVLLLVAVVVGTVSARERVQRRSVETQRLDLDALYTVASLVVDDAPVPQIVRSARAQLVRVLSLERCDFEPAPLPASSLPVLGRAGGTGVSLHRYVDGGFVLPPGAQLPARGRLGEHGRFVLFGRDGVGVPIQRIRAAVVLADLVGVALDSAGPADLVGHPSLE